MSYCLQKTWSCVGCWNRAKKKTPKHTNAIHTTLIGLIWWRNFLFPKQNCARESKKSNHPEAFFLCSGQNAAAADVLVGKLRTAPDSDIVSRRRRRSGWRRRSVAAPPTTPCNFFYCFGSLIPPVTKGFTVGLKYSKYSNLSSRYEFQSTSIPNPPHQVLPMTQQFCSNFTPLEEGNDTLTKCHCWIIALFAAPGPGCNKIGPQTTTRGQPPAADGRRWWEHTQHTKSKKHRLRCGHLHNTRGAARELD